MKVSEIGLSLIKSFEGLHLQAYLCPAKILTIGYGHTSGVMPNDRITENDADLMLCRDVKIAEQAINECVKVSLTQYQFDALVSFIFNVGVGNFRQSTLLKKLNAEDYVAAADEFLRWIKSGNKTLNGLIRRREVERAVFVNRA